MFHTPVAATLESASVARQVMLRVGTVVGCDENEVAVKSSDWTCGRMGTEEDVEESEERHGWGEVVGQWRVISAC